MTNYARLFKQIDQQVYDQLAARARTEWLTPPQPFRPMDLEAFLQQIDRDVKELARVSGFPVWLLEVPTVPSSRRPRLQDRLWSRYQTARRLLFRAFRR